MGKKFDGAVSRAGATPMLIGVIALAAGVPLMAQDGAVQDRVAAIEAAMTANAQKLHQYQWTETTQLTLNGDAKPPMQESCQYGPDGTVQKTPLTPPPPPPSGGRMKQRIIEKKKGEMQDYMGQVKTLLAMY